MNPVTDLRERIEAADDLGKQIAAALEAFALVRQACRSQAARDAAGFAAWTMAASAASRGISALGTAPAASAYQTTPQSPPLPAEAEADELSGLATVLMRHLAIAGQTAADPADQSACQQASEAASEIISLLGRGP